ncbi:hypothetical protein MKX03_030555 [Papaver bracteatum]|nr:hypothetical protein MKX03_030555 [Papaver bracteatum]
MVEDYYFWDKQGGNTNISNLSLSQLCNYFSINFATPINFVFEFIFFYLVEIKIWCQRECTIGGLIVSGGGFVLGSLFLELVISMRDCIFDVMLISSTT